MFDSLEATAELLPGGLLVLSVALVEDGTGAGGGMLPRFSSGSRPRDCCSLFSASWLPLPVKVSTRSSN